MKKLLFSGCSFTAGAGWTTVPGVFECKDHPNLWTNLICDHVPKFAAFEQINSARSGASNTEIFEITVGSMADHGSDIDTVFCQWTSMPRYNFNVGFELWDTEETFFPGIRNHDVNLNKGTVWKREYIKDLIDRIRTMHHLHWEILKVIKYTNIIINLAKKLKINNVFFINGLCPWDKNYFNKLENVKPESYTKFTKTNILNIESRDDEDIHSLYTLAHQHYQQAGGINENYWINLYDSFRELQTDTNFDNDHPGTDSNRIYSKIITDKLSINTQP